MSNLRSISLCLGVNREHVEQIKQVIGKADMVSKNWDTQYTDFYSPPIIKDALKCLDQMADITAFAWGGYEDAERARIVIGREEIIETMQQDSKPTNIVVPLKIEGNFMFDPASHRDFLGAILGTGIVREKVGDVLVQGEFGASVLTSEEIREYLHMELKQVRSVTVKTSLIDLSELTIPEKKVNEFSTSEASLRLDAVASSGFKCSRSQMVTFIKQGLVRVNYVDVTKSIATVKEGDLISCTGKGRVTIKNVELTKKGRYKVNFQQQTQ